MGRPYRELLDGSCVYACKSCRTHIAARAQLVSRYICAFEKSQKYKEGKVILERACVVDYDRSSALARRSSSCSTASSSGAPPTLSSPSMLAMDDQECESGSEDEL
ncbi:hypothetical protein QJQ45_022415 [Haematococcus lacustris]|nr:hypothetical protein QJQ45_005272 [Haematococcus lacustris]KAJ9523942.1 hypothetical protein QJQ45_022415 [Haematococcus lacustris]